MCCLPCPLTSDMGAGGGGRRLSALGTDSDFAFLWKDLVALGFPGAVSSWLARQTLGEEDGPRKQCLMGILQCAGKSWSHLIHTHGKTQLREFRNLSRVPQLRMLCPALSTGHSSLQNPSGLAVPILPGRSCSQNPMGSNSNRASPCLTALPFALRPLVGSVASLTREEAPANLGTGTLASV